MAHSPIDSPIEFSPLYLEFFKLFNEREYFEAHEVLEDLWVMEAGPEKQYLKGMIMVTIALEHWTRSNMSGAWKLFRDGMKYLELYPEIVMGFELGKFRNEMKTLFAEITLSEGKEPYPCDHARHPTLVLIAEFE